ncbi:hypothetical protein F4819DRAFT_474176 [Hypoxylon fuscum]|nr:hypothetical protein F4819DRAFT_474176 [Hypoxylon fuscum]
MDEFAQLSRENFEVFQRYGDALGPDPKHRAIAICASPSAPPTYVEKDLKLDQLPKFFENQNAHAAGVAQAASLKLVVMDSRLESWSNFSASLRTTKDVFLSLVDVMRMNPAALWLLRSEYDGFHHFESSSTSPFANDDGDGDGDGDGGGDVGADVNTYYVGTSNFVLVWTWDGRRRCTRALWILRQQQSFSNSAPVAWFVNVLRRHQAHAHSPHLLAYATALSTACLFDGETAYRAHVVRLTERETGYSTHSSSIEERLGMESLTVSIKEVGEVLNHIANKQRHFRFVDAMLDFVVQNAIEDPRDRTEAEEKSTRKLIAAIPLLRRRMHASRDYLEYLKERAERLSTVVGTFGAVTPILNSPSPFLGAPLYYAYV